MLLTNCLCSPSLPSISYKIFKVANTTIYALAFTNKYTLIIYFYYPNSKNYIKALN